METSERGTVTLLTRQGEFINIPWDAACLPEVGSEVEVSQPVILPYWKKVLRKKQLWALAAACLVIFFLSTTVWTGFLFPGSNQVVAYVSVDINPSIELGLNEKALVLEVRGYNSDGDTILQNLAQQKVNLKNVNVEDAIQLITDEAVKEKYLAPDKENNVVITVSGGENAPKKVKQLDQEAKKVLEKYSLAGETSTLEVPLDMHDTAKTLGVSPGKYVILMEAVDQGLNLSLDDVKGKSIVKAVKEAGGVPGKLISKAQQDKNELKDVAQRAEDKDEKIKEQAEKAREQLREEAKKEQGKKDKGKQQDRKSDK